MLACVGASPGVRELLLLFPRLYFLPREWFQKQGRVGPSQTPKEGEVAGEAVEVKILKSWLWVREKISVLLSPS